MGSWTKTGSVADETFEMPTNLIRPLNSEQRAKTGKVGLGRGQGRSDARHIILEAGRVTLKLALYDTPTAARIAQAVPLFGVAEPWGACLHFRLPIGTGRERGARVNGRLGEVYYWMEEDRVLIPFGPTPISRDNEVRLPRPCNPWAEVVGDVTVLKDIAPSAKVTLKA